MTNIKLLAVVTPPSIYHIGNVPNWTTEHISNALNKAIKFYGPGGFIVHIIMMDIECKKVVDKLFRVEFNTESS